MDGVEVKLDGVLLLVKGPKGETKQEIHRDVTVEINDAEKMIYVKVARPLDHRQNALWGLFRSLVFNMVWGAKNGFEKKLEINGIGYKAAAGANKITLNVGYSHPVEFELPIGVQCKVEANVITLSGADKQLVGEVAANIRKIRKPEPYKGKGIKYIDEVIRRKAGKAAAKSSA